MRAWASLAPETQVALLLLAIAALSVLVAGLVLLRALRRETREGDRSRLDWLDMPGMAVWTDTETMHAWAVRPEHAGCTIRLPDGTVGILTRVEQGTREPYVRLTVAGTVHRVPGHATVWLGDRVRPDDDGHLARQGWGT